MDEHNNIVKLRGHVTGLPIERELPSGDLIVSFRLTVPRSKDKRTVSKQLVDTFDCTAWTARMRKAALRLTARQQVVVEGALRRRFQRQQGTPMSYVSVEVDTCKPFDSLH
ncbi:hypothetical protein BH09ACT10_BH09ACT10_28170 [soil metagenome]